MTLKDMGEYEIEDFVLRVQRYEDKEWLELKSTSWDPGPWSVYLDESDLRSLLEWLKRVCGELP